MNSVRRRGATGAGRPIPILYRSFNWTRHRPYSMRGQAVVGGPDTRHYSLFVPIDRRTLYEWIGAAGSGCSEVHLFGAPPGTCVTTGAFGLADSFVARPAVPEGEERSWSVNIEVLDPDHVRFAIFARNRCDVESPLLGPRDLRWLELYWAAPEDEGEAFQALAEIAPADAVEVYLNGFGLAGQPEGPRRRLKNPKPFWLTPALERGDRRTRERAITAIGQQGAS
jgi:hypothetical protein